MNRLIIFIFCIVNVSGVFAQGDAVLDRLITFQSSGDDNGRHVAIDENHNTYLLGRFETSADFDPGPGIYNMTSAGGARSYLVKLNPAGDFVWAKQWGTTSTNHSLTEVLVDENENIYISGHWSGSSFDFDPGPGQVLLTTSSSSQARSFLLKLDSNGSYQWLRFIAPSTSSGTSHGNALAMDTAGYVYFAGGFSELNASVTTGIGNTNLTYVPLTASTDCEPDMSDFVIKFDSNGTIVWTKVFDLCGGVSGSADIVASSSGDIYMVGDFKGTLDIERATDTLSFDAGFSSDPYVMKLAPDSEVIWFRQFWSKDALGNSSQGNGIAVDNDDNIYFVGIFRDSIDMDPGAGSFHMVPVNANNYDGFLCKLDVNGDFLWSKQIGGTGNDFLYKAIDVDTQSNVYVAGVYFNTVNFSGQILTSSGQRDIFFLKADEDGNYLWVKRIGGTFNENIEGLVLDHEENIILSGMFSATVDLDPGVPVHNVVGDNSDAFHMKLKQCLPTTGTFTHTSCGPYFWYGVNYTSSNNTATHTLTNSAGCDSIVTLNLTVNQIPQSTFTHTSCGPYQWINGVTYSSSNSTAGYIIDNGAVNGCDSVINLNLTVININNTLSFNNGVLTSNQNGASYQWLDCGNGNTPIPGAVSQSLTLTQNGSYAVEITQNGCTKVSACFEMTNLGITNLADEDKIQIHPNPVANQIVIRNVSVGSYLTITDLTGKIMHSQNTSDEETVINIENLSNGVYFVNVSNLLNTKSEKFVVQK